MKWILTASLILLGLSLSQRLMAQRADSSSLPAWEHNVTFNYYFFEDQFIFLPTYEVDKGALHLAARYNYEDLRTFSGWVGYNFIGGREFQYVITPMAGAVVGRTDGFAGGLLVDLAYKDLAFYIEAEYVSDVNDHRNDYFYSWTDLSYSVSDAFWFGLSFQRTRLYQTDLDVQRGLLLGTSFLDLELTGYLFNLGFDDPFIVLALSKDF